MMYHWSDVEALKDYNNGDVIVIASSPDEARAKAIDYARARGDIDLYRLDNDLNRVDPDISDVIFIRGSA